MSYSTLRPVGPADLPLLTRWEHQPDLVQLMGQRFGSLEQWMADLTAGRVKGFVIEVAGRPVGSLEVGQFVWPSGEAELRLLIADPADRGHGYGSSALSQLCELAFGPWHLNQLYLRVYGSNKPALHLYRQAGFQAVGRLAPSARRGDPAPIFLMVLPKARYLSHQLSLAT